MAHIGLRLLVALSASLATLAQAGQGVWTSGGPYGESVYALAVDPAKPATVFAGAEGVFRSTDAGASWEAIFANQGVFALAIDPVTSARLYAGTLHGIVRSTDGGVSWTAEPGPDNGVSALAIDPVSAATVYAGTFFEGLFKSTDSGGTWTHIAAGPGYLDGQIFSLAVDPSTPSTVYAGVSGGPHGRRSGAALGGESLSKSTDAGLTWRPSDTGLSSAIVAQVTSVAIDPTRSSTLYAGTYAGGVFKSTDAGSSWAATNVGLPYRNVLALVIDPSRPSTLYAGAETNGATGLLSGVFKSTDEGGSWTALDTGLPNKYANSLAVDPTHRGTVFAGLQSGGVWQITPAPTDTRALLPTSAHAMGLGGAFYTTDVSVANVGATSTSFTLKFLGNGHDGSSGPEQTFSLDAGATTTLGDVLGSTFGETGTFGALRITSTSPDLAIASITSTPGFGGSFGQTIPPVSASDLIPPGSPRSILSIREGDGFRTNLVLASDAAVPTTVDVALVSPAGAILATKTYVVPPSGMIQVNRVVRDMGVSGPITGARLLLSSTTSGAAFTGLASVIDEATNDPTTILAQPALASGAAPFTWLLPASAHTAGTNGAFYTTSVSISNVGAAPVSFTMKFLGHDQDGAAGPEQTFDLEAGKSVTYFDVLGSVFGRTSTYGAIRITSSRPALNVVSVTSTPGFGGSFGQTIPAVPSADLIPAGASRSILAIREGDGFRTNLVLASGASVTTRVDVALVSPEGASLATKAYFVPPNGMTQINRVVRDMGVSTGVTGARLVLSSATPGAAFTAFASVIDEVTNDPTTIEAR